MSIIIVKRLEFDAGHRLLKHESKCAHIHGHRYAVEVEASAAALDAVGRVVDFSVIKDKVGGWLDDNLDHGFIAQQGDPIIEFLRKTDQKHYVMVVPPTAENLAEMIYYEATRLLRPHGVTVRGLTIYETPTSRARYVQTTAV